MIRAAETTTASVPRRRIPVIGIVGGIGSGKSAIANWVATRAKVSVMNADALGHEVLHLDTVKNALVEKFGSAILAADGGVERSAIAQRVFGIQADQLTARHDLEQIVHPEIGRLIAEKIEVAAAENWEAVLLDAAVLLEAGWRSKCDLIVFIDTPDSVRLERVREHRGWTPEELQRREMSQWSLMDKRRESDLIVENNGEIEQAGKELFDALTHRGLLNQK